MAEPPLSPQTNKSKSNPFGSAKPRELVLKEKGVDVKSLDAKFEAKAKVSRFSSEQEAQIESVRQELTRLEALWRDANEKELPEETYRLKVEGKRDELKKLMTEFSGPTATKGEKEQSTTEGNGKGKPRSFSNDGFTQVVAKQPGRGRGHYLPAKDGNGTADPFSSLSRQRLGTKAN